MPRSRLVSKTLQVTIWAVRQEEAEEEAEEVREECLGSAQVSLADFDCEAVSVRWYNVLSFRFMQQPGEKGKQKGSRSRLKSVTKQKQSRRAESRQGTLTKEESSDESTIISSQASTLTRDNAPAGGGRSLMVAAAALAEGEEEEEEDDDDEDEEEEEEEEDEEDEEDEVIIPTLPEMLDSFNAIQSAARTDLVRRRKCQTQKHLPGILPSPPRKNLQYFFSPMYKDGQGDEHGVRVCGPERRTLERQRRRRTTAAPQRFDCACTSSRGPVRPGQAVPDLLAIRPHQQERLRMQGKKSFRFIFCSRIAVFLFFTIAQSIFVIYFLFQLNRSDSDSAMSLHKKRLAFQKSLLERRSLRVPKVPGLRVAPPEEKDHSKTKKKLSRQQQQGSSSSASSSSVLLQTPLDLELDLAAQQTKLQVLQEEIDRLREIKSRLERAKEKGVGELPAWLQEHERFQQLLAKLQSDTQEAQSQEERRVDRMLRKTSRDIYRLRKTRTASRGQLDMQAFKEKMAFFTTLRNDVPVPMDEEEELLVEDNQSEGSSTLKARSAAAAAATATARVTVTHDGAVGKVVTLGASSTETVDTITAEEEEKDAGKEEEEEEEGDKKRSSSLSSSKKNKKSGSSVGSVGGKERSKSVGGKNKSRRSKRDAAETERFSYEIDPDIGVIV